MNLATGNRAATEEPIAPLIAAMIDSALAEDLGPKGLHGDLSVAALAADRAQRGARARVIAKASGVLSGVQVFVAVFETLARQARLAGRKGAAPVEVRFLQCASNGQAVAPGDLCFLFEGPGDLLLAGERTALNFLQRLSGVATRTREFVRAIEGTRAQILDTRKTTPGWRRLEKAAVRHGGGVNHRIGLYDQVLLKENHFALAGGDVAKTVASVRASVGSATVVIAEARTIDEALAAARSGADVVMLDNFELEAARAGVARLQAGAKHHEFPRAVATEISGGVGLQNVRAWAETGVDRISIGALTHSAPALDTSMLIDLDADAAEVAT